jgi:parallel beta-helix repeat protein
MRIRSIFAALAVPALFAACADDDPGATPQPDAGPACPETFTSCAIVSPGPDAERDLREAFIDAEPGTAILLAAGTYELTRELSLTVNGVTVRGAGMDETILSFANQTSGAQGILVTGDDFVAEDLAVEDTPGDGIKINGTSGVTLRRIRMEWTGGPSEDNGAYGLYPVQCENVLIEDSVVRGASDAGIYVGQSQNIIVRNNLAELNVAGIEIENSYDADVYGNTATRNTGGVLVFNLPGLQVSNGGRIRVFDNVIAENNTPNFAPEGNIVGLVPQGTGLAMIAAHEVEIFENEIRDNQTVNAGIVSYFITQLSFEDENYDPYSDSIYIYGNTFSGGGDDVRDDLGSVLIGALVSVLDDGDPIPDIVWDGVVDPDKSEDGELTEAYRICIQEDPAVTFGNIDLLNLTSGAHAPSLDIEPHACERERLPAVTLP